MLCATLCAMHTVSVNLMEIQKNSIFCNLTLNTLPKTQCPSLLLAVFKHLVKSMVKLQCKKLWLQHKDAASLTKLTLVDNLYFLE